MRPSHATQANTSKSNVLLSCSAWSTRGVLSFSDSVLAAAWGASLAPARLRGGGAPLHLVLLAPDDPAHMAQPGIDER